MTSDLNIYRYVVVFQDETFHAGDFVGTEEMVIEMFRRKAIQIQNGKTTFEKNPVRMHLMASEPSEDPERDFLETIDLAGPPGQRNIKPSRNKYD